MCYEEAGVGCLFQETFAAFFRRESERGLETSYLDFYSYTNTLEIDFSVAVSEL